MSLIGLAGIPNAMVRPLTPEDHAELLVLQRCCWVQEALLNDTLDIPALHETPDDLRQWTETWCVWCIRQEHRMVAAVRARQLDDVWEIGRLMVVPDLSGRGIGRWLLDYAEAQAPADTKMFSLFTGAQSNRNIRLYQRAGYRLVEGPPGVSGHIKGAVFLTKERLAPNLL